MGLKRRSLLSGLAAALAAPAVVQAAGLMPVRVWRPQLYWHGQMQGLWDGYTLRLAHTGGPFGGPVPVPPGFNISPAGQEEMLRWTRHSAELQAMLRRALPDGFRVSSVTCDRDVLERRAHFLTFRERTTLVVDQVTESRRRPDPHRAGRGHIVVPHDWPHAWPVVITPPHAAALSQHLPP